MNKNCRSCHFLCCQSDAVSGIGTNSEPWKRERDQTGKTLYALRSWSAEERKMGKIKDAVSLINMGKCCKGVWVANDDTDEAQERVGFRQSLHKHKFEKNGNMDTDSIPTAKCDLKHQINKCRQGCFWTPYQTGQTIDSAVELESKNHLSKEHKKTRTVAWLALSVSVVSLVIGLWINTN